LCRQALRGHGPVGFGTDLYADAHYPPIEVFEPGAARGAALEVAVPAAGRPEARELTVIEMTPAEALKK
jgi:hypothetical protein